MAQSSARLQKLRQRIRQAKADALLVTSFTNVTYLTGFTGDDSYLLITLDGEVLISDLRYTTQLEEECPELDVVARGPGEQMLPALVEVVEQAGLEKLAIESGSMTVGLFEALKNKLEHV
ncbi:MAG: aminopeptidase P family N-terminal domain-containing protein, partial [Aeoliella sp.]